MAGVPQLSDNKELRSDFRDRVAFKCTSAMTASRAGQCTVALPAMGCQPLDQPCPGLLRGNHRLHAEGARQYVGRVAIHGKCSRRFCGSSRNCGRSHHQRQHETFDSHAFKSNRRNECVRMPRKTARSGSQTPLGRRECREPSTLSHLGFQPVQKRLPSTSVQGSSGESRFI